MIAHFQSFAGLLDAFTNSAAEICVKCQWQDVRKKQKDTRTGVLLLWSGTGVSRGLALFDSVSKQSG